MDNDSHIQNLLRNLVYLRMQHGLSKHEMALRLGIGAHSWNLIESGTLPPRLGANVFYAVYDHFKIPPSVLLTQHLDEI